MSNNYHVKVFDEFLQICLLKFFLIYINIFHNKLEMSYENARTQIESVVSYLLEDQFEKRKSGYLKQIPNLLDDLSKVLPNVLNSCLFFIRI